MFSKTQEFLVKHLSTQAMPAIGQGQGGGYCHTTLINQDLVLVPGSGAGGHTTLDWVTGVYLSTVAATILLLLTMDQI